MRSLVLAFLVTACGGNNSFPDATPIPQPDVAIDAPVPCLASASYGTIVPADQEATKDAAVPEVLRYKTALNTDALPDWLWIELWKGSGVYETGEIVPGAIALSGPEINYATCGACVLIDVDNDATADTYEGTLLATGGTLNIETVTPNIKGTLSNVTLTQVAIDEDTSESTPIGNNCSTTVTSLAFDFPVTTEMAFRSHELGRHRRHP